MRELWTAEDPRVQRQVLRVRGRVQVLAEAGTESAADTDRRHEPGGDAPEREAGGRLASELGINRGHGAARVETLWEMWRERGRDPDDMQLVVRCEVDVLESELRSNA